MSAPLAPQPRVVSATHGDPLGPQHVADVMTLLSAALSSDTPTRTGAEAQIKALENRPGWRACILQVGLSPSNPDALRTLAMVLFKNQIDGLFRRTWGPATVSKDAAEKAALKRMLLSFHIDENGAAGAAGAPGTSERVAGLVSACVGMCARHEWPRDWSTGTDSLFPRLLEGLQSNTSLLVLRTLYTLHCVLKSLQASRLSVSVAKFQNASESIVACVRAKWMATQEHIASTLAAVLARSGSTGGSGAAAAAAAQLPPDVMSSLTDSSKLALLYLKCLRRLVTYGISDVSTSAESQLIFPFMLDQMQKLVHILPQLAHAPDSAQAQQAPSLPFLDPLFGAFHMQMRIVNDTLDKHPLQFRVFFVPFVQFATFVLNHTATAPGLCEPATLDGAPAGAPTYPGSSVLEPFCIECILYLQKVLQHYSKSAAASALAAGLALHGTGYGRGGGADGTTAAAGATPSGELAHSQIAERMSQVFSAPFLGQLCSLLVSHYLVLKRADMQCWAEEPEAFYNEERSGLSDGDDGSGDDTTLVVMSSRSGGGSSGSGEGGGGSEFKVRMVAENLVKLLLEKMPEVVAPHLLSMLMNILALCPAGSSITSASAAPLSPSAALAALGGAAAQPNLLLLKESIYTALGYGYLHIPRLLQSAHNTPFATFYSEVLLKELAQASEAQRPVRRRVIWLLGEWVEDVDDALRIQIYNSCVQLLHEDDLLVRMSAIDTLYKLIDNVPYSFEAGLGASAGGSGDDEHDLLDLTAPDAAGVGVALSPGFDALLTHFSTHLSSILGLLFHILEGQLEELESKRHVLIILAKVLGVMRGRLLTSGCLPLLVQHLPALWQGCEGRQNLLRSGILDVITKLVVALGYQSSVIHGQVVVPMLRHVLEPRNAASSTNFVVEYALDLWKCALQQAVHYTPELGALFSLLLEYMRGSTGYLRKCMEIIEGYIHLGKAEFMALYAAPIAEVFAGLLTASQQVRLEASEPSPTRGGGGGGVLSAFKAGSVTLSTALDGEGVVNEEAIVILMAVLESVAQIYPVQTPLLFKQTFHFMLKGLVDEAAFAALSDEQQAQSKVHVQCDQVLASYLIVLGRVLYQNVSGSMQLLQALSGPNPATQLPLSPAALLSTLLDGLHRKLDCVAHVYKKKVCVLAMVQLLQSGEPAVLAKLRIIMACVRRVEKELNQRGAQLEQPDWSAALQTPPEQRIEAHRIQLMLSEDPSNQVSVRTYFLEQLQQLSGKIGQQAVQQLISTCDPIVWQQIQQGNL